MPVLAIRSWKRHPYRRQTMQTLSAVNDSVRHRKLLLFLLLLVSGNVHPNPGPVRISPHRILQVNINAIQSSLAELIDFLHRQEISVACIQEIKLKRNNADPVIPGYSVIQKDRPRNDGGGGLLIALHSLT